MKKILAFLAAIAMAFLLTSCGGGGGSAGELGPSTRLRMQPSLETATQTAGTFSDVAKISQGVRPYRVSSDDISKVEARILDDGTLRIFGKLPGETPVTVTVYDSSVNQGPPIKLKVTVQALPPLHTDPIITDLTFYGPGGRFAFTVSGGMPPYLVDGTELGTSPDSTTFFTVRCVNPVGNFCPGHRYVVESNDVSEEGTGSFSITDQYRFATPPSTLKVNVTVKPAPLPPAMVLNPAEISGAIGTNNTVAISYGKAPYQALTSNASVATVTVSGQLLNVNFVGAGDATITVIDASGQTATVKVTVPEPPTPPPPPPVTPDLAVSPTAQNLSTLGAVVTFAVTGGKAPYTASVADLLDYKELVQTTVIGSNLIVARTTTACTGASRAIPIQVQDSGSPKQTVPVIVNVACP